MIKKTIEYVDFNGKNRVEDFYFNLNPAELAELDITKKGGFGDYLKEISAAEDGTALILAFKEIIAKTYGQRTEDGIHFYKSPKLAEDFMSTNAYAELFIGFMRDPKSLADFMIGVLPEKLQKEAALAIAKTGEDDRPAWLKEGRKPTSTEVRGMSREQLVEAMKVSTDEKNEDKSIS